METLQRREWKCLTCGQIQWKGKEGAHNSSTCKRKAKRKRDEEDVKEQIALVDQFCESEDLFVKGLATKQKAVLTYLIDERDRLMLEVKSLKGQVGYHSHQSSKHFREHIQCSKANEKLETEKNELIRDRTILRSVMEFRNEKIKNLESEKKIMQDDFNKQKAKIQKSHEQEKDQMRKNYLRNKVIQEQNHRKEIDTLLHKQSASTERIRSIHASKSAEAAEEKNKLQKKLEDIQSLLS